MRELFEETHEWAEATFSRGQVRRPENSIRHLHKEVLELLAAPYDSEEYADCFLLLMDAAQIAGHSYDDTVAAIRRKFEINKARTWGPTGADGVIEHVRTEERGNG